MAVPCEVCSHVGMHWRRVTNSGSGDIGPKSASKEDDDKDEYELTGQRIEVQRQDVGGPGGEESLSILYNTTN